MKTLLVAATWAMVMGAIVEGGTIYDRECGRLFGGGICNSQNAAQDCETKCQDFDYETGLCDDTGDNVVCHCGTSQCLQAVVLGEPLYYTFDGGRYWAHAKTRAILVKPIKASAEVPDFRIIATNECEFGDCDERRNTWFGSYPRVMEFTVYKLNITVIINNRRERWFEVNGRRTSLPWSYSAQNGEKFVAAQRISYWYYRCNECNSIKITTDFGLKIIITAGVRNIQVQVPPTKEYMGNIHGALGLLDGDRNNDMTIPNGNVFHDANTQDVSIGDTFLWHWRDPKGQKKPRTPKQKQCHGVLQRTAEQKCVTDFDKAFADCFKGPYMPSWIAYWMNQNPRPSWLTQSYIDRSIASYNRWVPGHLRRWSETLKKQCLMDFCLAAKPNEPIDNGACDSFEMFERNCRSYKSSVNIGQWRSRKFCPLECSAPNTHFEQCAGCAQSCDHKNKKFLEAVCGNPCDASGCVCNKGFVLDNATGNCVRRGRCGRG